MGHSPGRKYQSTLLLRWSNQQLPRGLPGMGCPFLRSRQDGGTSLCQMPSSTCQLLLMFNHILSLPIVNQISLNLTQQSALTNSKIFLSQNFSNAVNRRILPWD